MPPLHSVVQFALAAWAIIIVPGPSVLFVISRGVALGRKAALATVVGNAAGAAVQAVLVSVGLGSIVARSTFVFNAVKIVGALYLIWLGIKAFRSRHLLTLPSAEDGGVVRSTRRIIREGFTVGVTNPKTTVFFAAVLPQFTASGGGSQPLQMLVLSAVFIAIALLSDGAYGLLAGTASAWFKRSPRRLQTVAGAGGLAIVGLGIHLALSRRAD
jgi:threonine/homoserine/homoserine lactone efflux protein